MARNANNGAVNSMLGNRTARCNVLVASRICCSCDAAFPSWSCCLPLPGQGSRHTPSGRSPPITPAACRSRPQPKRLATAWRITTAPTAPTAPALPLVTIIPIARMTAAPSSAQRTAPPSPGGPSPSTALKAPRSFFTRTRRSPPTPVGRASANVVLPH